MAPWHPGARAVAVLAALAAFVGIGFFGVYRYVDNYWAYRGFARPQDPAYVKLHGDAIRIDVRSPALGGRVQPVDVYLPPGYTSSPHRRYPVLYLLHGEPGRPGAFLATVRLGVVEDELTALHRARPAILVMPFGSTGSFTDKEWANGVRPNEEWETFVARDVVRAIDTRFRTIRAGWARGIGGLSEGGYGAINIAIHHPGEFGLVESWSGYQKADDLGSIFGHRQALLTRNTPLDTIAAAAPALRAARTFFWLYTGKDDHFLDQNKAFVKLLARDGIQHRFRLVDGGHNWALWRGNAGDAYLAASKHLVPASLACSVFARPCRNVLTPATTHAA
jgi:enterochelin esterase-like enzyme